MHTYFEGLLDWGGGTSTGGAGTLIEPKGGIPVWSDGGRLGSTVVNVVVLPVKAASSPMH